MKAAKILSVYAGSRRNANNNFLNGDQCISFLELQIENEKILDPGYPMDLIIINNDVNNIKANSFIHSLDGQSIFNGKIHVFFRPNEGGSFGAFSYGYDMINDNYDFFLFNEDDIMITHPGYLKRAIDILNEDQNIGFIAFSPISYYEPYHCGGGFGVTSKRILEKIKTEFGKLPYSLENTYHNFEQSEILFTNCIHKIGHPIVNIPEYSPLASNYMKHTSQNVIHYVNSENLSKLFIYKVGF